MFAFDIRVCDICAHSFRFALHPLIKQQIEAGLDYNQPLSLCSACRMPGTCYKADNNTMCWLCVCEYCREASLIKSSVSGTSHGGYAYRLLEPLQCQIVRMNPRGYDVLIIKDNLQAILLDKQIGYDLGKIVLAQYYCHSAGQIFLVSPYKHANEKRV